jgi:hypothetical protein
MVVCIGWSPDGQGQTIFGRGPGDGAGVAGFSDVDDGVGRFVFIPETWR